MCISVQFSHSVVSDSLNKHKRKWLGEKKKKKMPGKRHKELIEVGLEFKGRITRPILVYILYF